MKNMKTSLLIIILTTAVVIQATPFNLFKGSGRRQSNPNDAEVGGKIYGGTRVTDETKHPYQVRIEDGLGFVCGGSIIAADVILTSTSCVYQVRVMEMFAGDVDVRATTGKEQVRRATSANVTLHPDFISLVFRNDVAIIKLDNPFDLNDYVNVIALERENLTHNLHAGEEGTILGWGATSDTSNLSGLLYEADGVVIITYEKCSEVFGFLNEGVMCIDTSNKKSPCDSDTGSPFIQVNNGRPVQIGISSFIDKAGCTVGYPAGLSRVSVYVGWIESKLGRSLL